MCMLQTSITLAESARCRCHTPRQTILTADWRGERVWRCGSAVGAPRGWSFVERGRTVCGVPCVSSPVRSGLEESLQESSSRSLVRFMSLYHVFQEPRARRVLRHNTLSLDNDPIALPERGGRSPAARWRFRLRGRIRSGRARVMDQLRWLRKDTLVRLSRLASTAHKPPSTFVRPPCTGHNPSQMSRT